MTTTEEQPQDVGERAHVQAVHATEELLRQAIPKRSLETLSPLEHFAILPEQEIEHRLDAWSVEQVQDWLYSWDARARKEQIAPTTGLWRTWLIQAGRGFGKTRAGAEWVRRMVAEDAAAHNGRSRLRIALVGRTAADVRDVMLEGESGLLNIGPPHERPRYQPSLRRVIWPNGALAITYSADEPKLLRGPQHHIAWCDEIAAWRFEEAWDNLQFGLRLGENPQAVCTTTPKPTQLMKRILKSEMTVVTRGSSFDNIANLSPAFFDEIIKPYLGTTLGLQEIFAQLVENVEGALWNQTLLDLTRVRAMPALDRIVVAIDPSVSDDPEAAETGIIIAGRAGDHGYVFGDFSLRASPERWISTAASAYHNYQVDRIVAEVNQGGKLVEALLRTLPNGKNIAYREVWAHDGKRVRAEPVASLYEQQRIHHVGVWAELESQLTTWVPASGQKSPDRLDALVWALTDLFLGQERRVATAY